MFMSNAKPLLYIVDDESSILAALERILRSEFHVRTFLGAEAALQELEREDPALVLTDSIMPQMSGLDFLKKVRDLRPNSIRVLLSGQIATEELSQAINWGLIHRFFLKPWDSQILKLHLLECLQQRNILVEKDHLATLALTDPVTGLGNHRKFQEQIRVEIERSRRHGRALSLLMMDIDNFKSWNDQFGHPAGDLLLKEISTHLTNGLRQIDWIARYGGDEFAILLPDTSTENAFLTAERLRKSFAPSQKSNQSLELVSLSFGVATFPEHGKSAKDLVLAADQALYQAKNKGRNQSIIAAASN